MLSGKNVLVGVTGGIAAYKVAFLVRLLIKKGANVQVVMTEKAKEFVTPLTLSTLSKNPVLSSFTKTTATDDGLWNNHVALGLWADYMLIAPATANTLSKMAHGHCNNFLLATYLSAKCPVYVAPAMDLDMYKHGSTGASLTILEQLGNRIIPATSGELASGLVGPGRMAEPEDIIAFLEKDIREKLPLYNKTVLITAGPTHEAIDPVRFIGNHSSGKMGFALARQAAQLGATVILVTGPTSLQINQDAISVYPVVSARQMYDRVHMHFADADIVIAAAAVADYTPRQVADQKIKKKTDLMSIDLVPTKDILASLGAIKTKQFLVGFALETNNELEHALGKLTRKNLDAIVLNSMRDKGAGFAKSTNKITFIDKNKKQQAFALKTKQEVAIDIFNQIIQRLDA